MYAIKVTTTGSRNAAVGLNSGNSITRFGNTSIGSYAGKS
jgi:hypothetical protein